MTAGTARQQAGYLLLWFIVPGIAVLLYPYLKGNPQHLEWLAIAITIYVLFFSVVIHELSHGLAGAFCGDTTALDAGRITLHPVRHVSPVGSILVPLGLYFMGASVVLGWAKPVPFNPIRLRKHPRDQVFLAFAGPLSNFCLAYISFTLFLVAAFIYNGLSPEAPIGLNWDIFTPIPIKDVPFAPFWFVLLEILNFGIFINAILGVFNLIPFPPLDGFWLLKALLPKKAAAFAGKIQILGFILLILALHFNLLTFLFYPMLVVLGIFQGIAMICLR